MTILFTHMYQTQNYTHTHIYIALIIIYLHVIQFSNKYLTTIHLLKKRRVTYIVKLQVAMKYETFLTAEMYMGVFYTRLILRLILLSYV